MSLLTLLHLCVILAPSILAVPTVTFPLNSQVPPVARTSKPFSYTFSSSTFSSKSAITYKLTSGPEWLMLDGATRTLHGVPSDKFIRSDSVTGISISITATDATGSTSMNSTLVVTNKEAPSVKIPAALQLTSFGKSSPPSTLLYHPSSSFDFKFDRNTFSGNALQYYAVADGNTPLPSWITFDRKALSFTGRTSDQASLAQPPQTFGIQLIASDVEGFAGTSISFGIKVGVHLLTIVQDDLAIEAVLGENVDFTGLLKAILIDGRQAERRELESVIVDMPRWLNLNNNTLALTGTVPKDTTSFNITVNVTDIYKDTISATILVDVAATMFFKAMVGNLNATIGYGFWYDLSPFLKKNSKFEVGVDFKPKQSWTNFDSTKLTISGVIPENFPPGEIMVELHARSKSSQVIGTQTFKLVISEGLIKPPSASPSTTVISATPKPGLPPQPSSRNFENRGIIAISIPLAALVMIILLALLCHLRRQKKSISSCFTHISKSDISLPREQKQSNPLEITMLRRSPTPEPLHLDMSGFGQSDATSLSISPVSPLSVPSVVTNSIRGPKNESTWPRILSDQQYSKTTGSPYAYANIPKSELQETPSSSSNASLNWTSTPDSNYPERASSKINYSHRLQRRFSRKHKRHPATTLTPDKIRTILQNTVSRPSSAATRSPKSGDLSGTNLQDVDFSFLQLNDYFLQSSNDSTDSSQLVKRPKSSRFSRNWTRFVPESPSPKTQGKHDSFSSLSTQPNPVCRDIRHQDSFATFNLPSEDSLTWLSIGIASTTNLSQSPITTRHHASPQLSQIPPRNFARHTQTSTPNFSSRRFSPAPSQNLTMQTQTSPTSTNTNWNWMRTLNSYADSPTMPVSTSHSSFASVSSDQRFSRNVPDIDTLPSQSQSQDHYQKGRAKGKLIDRGRGNVMQIPRSTASFASDFESTSTSLLDFPLPPGSETHFSEMGMGHSVSHQSMSTWKTHSSSFNGDEEVVVALAKEVRGSVIPRWSGLDRSNQLATAAGGGGERNKLVFGSGSGNIGVRIVDGKAMMAEANGFGEGRKRTSTGKGVHEGEEEEEEDEDEEEERKEEEVCGGSTAFL